jgi:hypothetical protein
MSSDDDTNGGPAAELHRLFRTFLVTRDAAALVRFVDENPFFGAQICLHEHPAMHRIGDFAHGSRAFRVCRCFSCNEQLTVLPLEDISPRAELGVPYDITGEGRARWVAEETDSPWEDEPDWSRYR